MRFSMSLHQQKIYFSVEIDYEGSMTETQELELFGKIGTFVEKVNNLTTVVEKNSNDINGLKKFKWMFMGALTVATSATFGLFIKVFFFNG